MQDSKATVHDMQFTVDRALFAQTWHRGLSTRIALLFANNCEMKRYVNVQDTG